jgi:hypothetical protein
LSYLFLYRLCLLDGRGNHPNLLPVSAVFLLILLFYFEEGGNMFLRNIWSPNSMVLQPGKQYSSSQRRENVDSNKIIVKILTFRALSIILFLIQNWTVAVLRQKAYSVAPNRYS